MSTSDPRFNLIVLVGLGVAGLLVLLIVLPLVARVSLWVEAWTLIMEAIGDYIGHPRLALFGCVILGMMLCACCIVGLLISGSLLTCGTANASTICHLVGR